MHCALQEVAAHSLWAVRSRCKRSLRGKKKSSLGRDVVCEESIGLEELLWDTCPGAQGEEV